MSKVDHLGLCNVYNVPTNDFTAQHCNRCFQSECVRSQYGKSNFDSRVTNWEDRLFTNVLRLDPSDPRYQTVTAPKFLEIPIGHAHVQSAWLDPREIETPVLVTVPQQIVLPVQEPVKEPEVLVEAPKEPEKRPDPVQSKPSEVGRPLNTPNVPRQMLGGGAVQSAAPVLDPWQPKQGLRPGEVAVQPGAKIRF